MDFVYTHVILVWQLVVPGCWNHHSGVLIDRGTFTTTSASRSSRLLGFDLRRLLRFDCSLTSHLLYKLWLATGSPAGCVQSKLASSLCFTGPLVWRLKERKV
jgi:hypothetical protein